MAFIYINLLYSFVIMSSLSVSSPLYSSPLFKAKHQWQGVPISPQIETNTPHQVKTNSKYQVLQIEESAESITTIVNRNLNYDFSKAGCHVNDGNFTPLRMRFLGQSLFQEEIKMCLFRNALSKAEFVSLRDGGNVDLYCIRKYFGYRLIFPSPKRILDSPYETKVALVYPDHCHPYFGHFVTDALVLMLATPKWVFQERPVVCISHPRGNAWSELVKAALPEDCQNLQIYYTRGRAIFAEKMYVVIQSAVVYTCTITNLSIKLRNYFKLDSIKPDKMGYMNKEIPRRRYFYNLDEFIHGLEQKYGKFVKTYVNMTDKVMFYKDLASFKVLVCPGGSLAYNAIFMARGTGIFILTSRVFDTPNTKVAMDNGMWSMQIIHKNISHDDAGNVDIARAAPAFDIFMQAMKDGKWPSLPPGYEMDFDPEKIKRLISASRYKWHCNLGNT